MYPVSDPHLRPAFMLQGGIVPSATEVEPWVVSERMVRPTGGVTRCVESVRDLRRLVVRESPGTLGTVEPLPDTPFIPLLTYVSRTRPRGVGRQTF